MTSGARSSNSRLTLFAVVALVFALAVTLRVWDVSSRFWLLGDQIRDWRIALGPFADLPLVGPATHVNGYTVGPAFYWILWAIRVAVGPWFDNLPHAGGIGQALLQSASDVMLLVAVWRRSGSVFLALTTCVLLVSASYDLALSSLVWNPVVGSTLAKMATAMVLLGWHRGSIWRVAVTAVVAWSAVHAYTGAIYVTVSVFMALLLEPLAGKDWRGAWRRALTIAGVVALLQVPYVAHQFVARFTDSAMGAVTDSVGRILSGRAAAELTKSVAGYASAVSFIQIRPWNLSGAVWLLVPAGAIIAVRYRRDPALLCMTLVPQLMAILGYAFFLAALDNYYYLSLMPAAVLTVIFAVTALPPSVARTTSVALLAGALALVPGRYRFAQGLHSMPEYRALVAGSRTVARRGQPMRAIQTDFRLPPTADPEFIYGILGGQLDRQAPWIAVITREGGVEYRPAQGR